MQQLSAITKTLILTGFSALSLWTAPTQAASFRGLGLPYSSYFSSYYANGVSADGSVIAGRSDYIIDSIPVSSEAFRWTESGGMVDLGYLPDDFSYSDANGVSADGSVIVGSSTSFNGRKAFRWTESGGMVSLGDLPGGDSFSQANGVSADGSVIVGSSDSVNGIEAFRWTESGGMVGLGDLPGGSFSEANGVSADGSVIVGRSDSVNGDEAFRWTESGGMVSLGDLPGGDSNSYANGVSADGSVIVGRSYGDNGNEAFHWTQGKGMVSLKETLIGKGLDVSGWTLYSATAISADGFTIVGNGINPSGQREGWVANLSPEPIPEPLTILGSIAAIAFGAGFERKFNKNKSEEKDPEN
ncbi:MAG: PEP-CTERM sorting domain-containing protein [Snowella sp.]|nr:PEP-CTERM sorting domain-containing protein [Snowella sp.]